MSARKLACIVSTTITLAIIAFISTNRTIDSTVPIIMLHLTDFLFVIYTLNLSTESVPPRERLLGLITISRNQSARFKALLLIVFTTMTVGFFVTSPFSLGFVFDIVFMYVPGFIMYKVALALGVDHPEHGLLWEGGHGPVVLSRFGVSVVYEALPVTILVLAFKAPQNKMIR